MERLSPHRSCPAVVLVVNGYRNHSFCAYVLQARLDLVVNGVVGAKIRKWEELIPYQRRTWCGFPPIPAWVVVMTEEKKFANITVNAKMVRQVRFVGVQVDTRGPLVSLIL